jgi:hypothetical protein
MFENILAIAIRNKLHGHQAKSHRHPPFEKAASHGVVEFRPRICSSAERSRSGSQSNSYANWFPVSDGQISNLSMSRLSGTHDFFSQVRYT